MVSENVRLAEIEEAPYDCKIEFWAGAVPVVKLISYPIFASQKLARFIRAYKGIYDTTSISLIEELELLEDAKKTALGTPLEMIYFVFLINDVPRSWTHQAVRTRVGASYIQESTRFLGERETFKVIVPKSCEEGLAFESYKTGIREAISNYLTLVEKDEVPSQDARQVLPHALLTHMFWGMSLKTLMGVYNVRWCCQSEPTTWLPVMKQMKDLIQNRIGSEIADFLQAPIQRGESCGFGASFDRPCTWRERPDDAIT